jgi:hypothetical protein
MRSTPSAACEIFTYVQPLTLRREMAAIKTFESCKIMDMDHPNGKLVDNWSKKQRLKQKSEKQKSVMHHVREQQQKYHLPEFRQYKKSEIAPHVNFHAAEIKH